jgi:hypothetical protein
MYATQIPWKKKVVIWLHFGSKECEFYDSFGRLPEDYDIRLRNFIDRNSFVCVYDDVQVQSDSASTCSFHVLFYLYRRAQGFSTHNSLRTLNWNNSGDIVRHFILKKKKLSRENSI